MELIFPTVDEFKEWGLNNLQLFQSYFQIPFRVLDAASYYTAGTKAQWLKDAQEVDPLKEHYPQTWKESFQIAPRDWVENLQFHRVYIGGKVGRIWMVYPTYRNWTDSEGTIRRHDIYYYFGGNSFRLQKLMSYSPSSLERHFHEHEAVNWPETAQGLQDWALDGWRSGSNSISQPLIHDEFGTFRFLSRVVIYDPSTLVRCLNHPLERI